jgi:hypothetical protein
MLLFLIGTVLLEHLDRVTFPIKVLEQRGPYQGAQATRSLSRCSSNMVPIKKRTMLLFLIGTVLLEHLDRVRVAYLDRVCVVYLDRVRVAYLDRISVAYLDREHVA